MIASLTFNYVGTICKPKKGSSMRIFGVFFGIGLASFEQTVELDSGSMTLTWINDMRGVSFERLIQYISGIMDTVWDLLRFLVNNLLQILPI